MKTEELRDRVSDMAAETANLSDMVLSLVGVLDGLKVEAESKLDAERLSNSFCTVSTYLLRISRELDYLSMPFEKNNLEVIRKAKGLTLDELSDLSGIPCEKLQSIELGEETTLSSQQMVKLAEVLHVMPSDIFE